jgi:agmatinase
MARVAEFTTKITQVGIRAQCKEEFHFIKSKGISAFYAHEIRNKGFNGQLIDAIIATLEKNVYVTFDVDYFDPSIMPSTGTPEPNGFYWHETMQFLKEFAWKETWLDLTLLSLRQEKISLFLTF